MAQAPKVHGGDIVTLIDVKRGKWVAEAAHYDADGVLRFRDGRLTDNGDGTINVGGLTYVHTEIAPEIATMVYATSTGAFRRAMS